MLCWINGSANITTTSWGTARTVTIGSTGKSVDGSAAVSWTLAEIGAPAKYSVLIGNGSSTAITVTHNLGTQDIIWSIREVSTNEFVDCDVVATSTTTATFTFATAPATNAYKVVIMG